MKKILKTIYTYLPFKKELFSIIKMFWMPKESIFKHLYFKGIFTVKIDNTKHFKLHHHNFQIENEIFWTGLQNCWEKESIKLWIKLCENAQTIIDIGANTGIYSLIAKTINPKSKVYSFEPHPLFFKILCQNITANGFDITPYEKAVTNQNEPIIIEDYSGHSSSIKTDAITLDTFIKQNAIQTIDLIKIDVEKNEPQVLEGFSEYLNQFKPTILIEILNEEIAECVFNYVSGIGYLYFNIDEKGNVRQTDKIEKSDYYNYLLCNVDTAMRIDLIASYQIS